MRCPGHQLHVVVAAAEDAWILVAPGDPGAPLLLVHVAQDVLVVPEVVAVAYRAAVLLGRELLGGVAPDHLVELRRRLGQVRGDPEVLDVAAHHRSVEVGGDVAPGGRVGMGAAHEHARCRWQRLVAHLLATGLGRAGPDVRAVAVVDEPGLVDAPPGRRDAGTGAAGHCARVIGLALHGRTRSAGT